MNRSDQLMVPLDQIRSGERSRTVLMVFYGAFAAAGAIVPWYFNIRYMRNWWFYVVTTFLVAFAFAHPLFLVMREAPLQGRTSGR